MLDEEEEGDADCGGMVRPSQQEIAPSGERFSVKGDWPREVMVIVAVFGASNPQRLSCAGL